MDYYGRWKALHYFVKEAYENTMLTSFEENGKLTVHCISDLEKQEEAILKLKLMDFDGNVLWQDSLSFMTPSNSSSPVFEISTAEYFKRQTFGYVARFRKYKFPAGKILLTCIILPRLKICNLKSRKYQYRFPRKKATF